MKTCLKLLGKNPDGKRFTFSRAEMLEFTNCLAHVHKMTIKVVSVVATVVLVGFITVFVGTLFGLTFFLNLVGVPVSVWQLFAAMVASLVGLVLLKRIFKF